MVLDWSWRNQCELIFKIYINERYEKNIYITVCVYELVHIHISLALSAVRD